MDMSFFLKALFIVATLTTLTVEAIKKIADSVSKKYNSTVLAVIISVILSIVCSVCFIIYSSITITPQVIVEIIALTFLSFLCATVGYDKVIKEIFKKGSNNE